MAYQALLDATRHELACHYLACSAMPIAEVGYLLATRTHRPSTTPSSGRARGRAVLSGGAARLSVFALPTSLGRV